MLNSRNSGKIFFYGMIFIYLFQIVFSFIAQSIAGGELNRTNEIIERNVALLYILINLGLFLAIVLFKEKDYKITSSIKKVNPVSLLWLILIFAGTLLTGLALSNFFIAGLEAIGYSGGEGIIPSMNTVPELLVAIVIIAVLPSVFEEFFVRGAILDGLRKNGYVAAIFLSALFFMLMHGSAEQTVHQFLFGLIAAYIVIISGSLLTGMIFHFANNLTTVLLVFFTSGATGEEAEIITFAEMVPTLLVMLAIGVALLYAGLKFYTEHLARARIKADPARADEYVEITKGKKNLKFLERLCVWFVSDKQPGTPEADVFGEPVFVPTIRIEQKEKLDSWIYIAIGLGAALWLVNFVLAFI